MAEITIGYFLEDLGQERFLVALVERIAQEKRVPPDILRHDKRNVTGGQGKALIELRRFLRDVRRKQEYLFDLLVVAIDGNCHGYVERQKEIKDIVTQSSYQGSVVCAVPDPHIERWYMIDPSGFQQALGTHIVPHVPVYKCERDRYKHALRQATQQAGIIAPLGGAEYGQEIARTIHFYDAGKEDTGFKHFIDDLQAAMEQLRALLDDTVS